MSLDMQVVYAMEGKAGLDELNTIPNAPVAWSRAASENVMRSR